MVEGTVSDLFKYQKEPPEDPGKLLNWFLDINKEFFSQELSRAVSISLLQYNRISATNKIAAAPLNRFQFYSGMKSSCL